MYIMFFNCFLFFATLSADRMPVSHDSSIVITCTTAHSRSPHEKQLECMVTIPEGEFIYHDSIAFSVDTPSISLSPWHTSAHSVSLDEGTKQTRKIYKKSFVITLVATADTLPVPDPVIHVSGYNGRTHTPFHYQFLVRYSHENNVHHEHDIMSTTTADISTEHELPESTCTPESSLSWTDYIVSHLAHTDSLFIQLLFAFILGLLLSLTPCIYPMIPITIGIIQAQAEKSIIKNFLASLSYSLGIAMTYATLGALVAYTGQQFGAIAHNPWVITVLVTVLLYLAFSMIGLYELSIPRFLQFSSSRSSRKKGSLIAAFVLGAMSGTVASPCLSPGLILLLSIAATVNKVTGFLLLLSFGCGLSILLLCIGTCAGSLAILPHSGMWMVEIKRFFGFIMLGMCSYFIRPFSTPFVMHALNTVLALGIGFFYLCKAQSQRQRGLAAPMMTGVGIILCSLGVMGIFYSVKEYAQQSCPHINPFEWRTSYNCARDEAVHNRKLLLVDVTSPSCSLCDLIEKKFFIPHTFAVCNPHFVFVRLNTADSADQCNTAFCKNYRIVGTPTILVIDPRTEHELARYNAELYDKERSAFVAELEHYFTQFNAAS